MGYDPCLLETFWKENIHKNREQYKTTLLKEIRPKAKFYNTNFKSYWLEEGFAMSLKKAGKI